MNDLVDAIVIYPPKPPVPELNTIEQFHLGFLLAHIFGRWPSNN